MRLILAFFLSFFLCGCSVVKESFEWQIVDKKKEYTYKLMRYEKPMEQHMSGNSRKIFIWYKTYKDFPAGNYLNNDWMEREEKFKDGQRYKEEI